MFIAFEGLDGSGSSTQARLLKEKLEASGLAPLLTKEPTSDSPIGKMIRDILQHKWECSPHGLQLLFSADRAEHLHSDIEPALLNGRVVITDRYLFSTLAYGSLAINDWDWLKKISLPFRLPDITFLLKLDPDACIKRIHGRGSDFELFEQHEKLKEVWKGYERIAQEFSNVVLIDAAESIEVIAEEVWAQISARMTE